MFKKKDENSREKKIEIVSKNNGNNSGSSSFGLKKKEAETAK